MASTRNPRRITSTYDRDLLATVPSSSNNNYDLSLLNQVHVQSPVNPNAAVFHDEPKMETVGRIDVARPPFWRTKKGKVVIALIVVVVVVIVVVVVGALVRKPKSAVISPSPQTTTLASTTPLATITKRTSKPLPTQTVSSVTSPTAPAITTTPPIIATPLP